MTNLSLNVRSFIDLKRRIALSNTILALNSDIVCLTETWLVPEIPDEALFLSNFSIARCDRPSFGQKSRHLGVLIAIKSHLIWERLNSNLSPQEYVAIKITNGATNLLLCCLYNPPQNSPCRRKELELQTFLESLVNIQKESNCQSGIIVGDINFKDTIWKEVKSQNPEEIVVLKTLTVFNFEQLFSDKKKQLDVLLTSNPNSVLNWKVNHNVKASYNIEGRACSDHNAYEVLISLQGEEFVDAKKETYAFHKADWRSFNESIVENPFSPYCYSIVNKLLRQWYSWLWEKLKQFVPRVTHHRASLPPWVTSGTSHILKKLKTLNKRITSLNGPSVRLRLKLKRMEKLLKQSLLEDRAAYEAKVFAGRRFTDLQKYLNKIKTSRKYPRKMHLRDQIVTEDGPKADLIDQFFASTFQTDDSLFPTSGNHLPVFLPLPDGTTCRKITVNESEIRNILENLQINKALGHDGVRNIILKNLSQSLPKSLLLLFQTCLNKSSFPNTWKTCQVTPIFKDGDKTSIDCYRPISLLCSLSEVLEKVIFEALYEHVEDKLSDCQFGFRKKRSTVLQMVVFLKKVYEFNDAQSVEKLCILYLDFPKAFDKVPHGILLQKLHNIGVHRKTIELIADYLTARTQFVKINNETSSPKKVTSGVPQGSILGPLLFIIFINDLPNCTNYSLCYGYCDDLKILSTTPEGMQEDVKNLENWCSENSMILNNKKCKLLNVKGSCQIQLLNSQLQDTFVHRDLGIQMTANLSWSSNCEPSVQSAIKAFYLIKRKVSSKASTKSKLDLYIGYIVPIATYASQVWYANKSELKQLERIQRKATAWILSSTEIDYPQRLRLLMLLPLSMYIELHDILFLFAVKNQKYDINIEDYTGKTEINRSTRQVSRGELNIPKPRLKKSEENFWVGASQLHNLFSHLINFDQRDLPSLKSTLTDIYWRFFTKFYHETNDCMWRVLCMCGSCNPPGKLLDL